MSLVVFILKVGAAGPPAAGGTAGAGTTVARADQLAHHPVERLLDDDGNDVKKRVNATDSN